MGKVKIKKKSTFIDMTAMSDVTVLLLTFFMLTSTFVKKEPVKVATPSSVSEIKIPDKNLLTVLVDPTGKVFMSCDQNMMSDLLTNMGEKYGMSFDPKQTRNFVLMPTFGSPMNQMDALLKLKSEEVDKELPNLGIPTDSAKNGGASEFQEWIKSAYSVNSELKLAIKADSKTPYKVVKTVMGQLQDIDKNTYYLITNLKKIEED